VQQIHHGLIIDSFEAGDVEVESAPWGGGAAVDFPSKSITRSATGDSLHGFIDGSEVEGFNLTDLIPLRRVIFSVPTLLWGSLTTLAQKIKDWILTSGEGGGIDGDLLDSILDETDGRYWRTGATDGTTTKGNFVYDNSSNQAIDIANRRIYTKAVSPSIDADTRKLLRADNVASVDWGNLALNDCSGAVAISWHDRYAFDSLEAHSIDWGARQLYDALQQLSADWNARELSGDWTALADFKAATLHVGNVSAAADWQTCDVVTDVAVDGSGHVTSITKKTIEYIGKAPV
jgi:hypothetical protein